MNGQRYHPYILIPQSIGSDTRTAENRRHLMRMRGRHHWVSVIRASCYDAVCEQCCGRHAIHMMAISSVASSMRHATNCCIPCRISTHRITHRKRCVLLAVYRLAVCITQRWQSAYAACHPSSQCMPFYRLVSPPLRRVVRHQGVM